jgi:hypothetical protein
VTQELTYALRSLNSAVDSLVVVASTLDAEVPLYSVGGLGLAVASIGEQVTNRGLEVHAAAHALRPDSHRAAGLADPKLLAYVHALISTGRVPGAEAGRWV